MWRQLLPGLRMTLVLTVLTGLIYPGIVTGLCQMLFPKQANGSLEYKDGKIIGSTLIGQNFIKPVQHHHDFHILGVHILRRQAVKRTVLIDQMHHRPGQSE